MTKIILLILLLIGTTACKEPLTYEEQMQQWREWCDTPASWDDGDCYAIKQIERWAP